MLREAVVEYFCVWKQKVIMFPIFRENGWVTSENVLNIPNI
jgi:hypothetical protein